MKVLLLNKANKVYSSNAYLVLGSWSRLEDVNTLIDTGTDESILDEIEKAPTGVGKQRVEQVVLTHNHFDHIGNLSRIVELYKPKVYAFSDGKHVDETLHSGQVLRIGDRNFEVIHAPGHSSDSVCLYCEEEGALFSGDSSLRIMTAGGTYSKEFIGTLETLIRLKVNKLYPGHEKPIKKGVHDMIETTLENVKTAGFLCF